MTRTERSQYIFDRHNAGITFKELAAEFSRNPTRISQIYHRHVMDEEKHRRAAEGSIHAPIDKYPMSARLANGLKNVSAYRNHTLKTMLDLTNVSVKDLLGTPNIGKISIKELEAICDKLHIRMLP